MAFKVTALPRSPQQPVKRKPTSSPHVIEAIRQETKRNSNTSFDSSSIYSTDSSSQRASSDGLDTTPEPSIDGGDIKAELLAAVERDLEQPRLAEPRAACPSFTTVSQDERGLVRPPARPPRNPLRLQIHTTSMQPFGHTPPTTDRKSGKSASPSINTDELQSFLELETGRQSSFRQSRASSSAPSPIFVCGNLADPILLSLVLFGRLRDRKDFKAAKAIGHELRTIEGSRFPVLVSSGPLGTVGVEGLLLRNLSSEERSRIKNFLPRLQDSESGAQLSLLRKTNIKVELADGEVVDAVSFVWNDWLSGVHKIRLSEEHWDAKAARKQSLKAYAATFWGPADDKQNMSGLNRQRSVPSF